MRHDVVERMFRDQYCMRDCDQVDVKFIMMVDGVSEFLIEDYVYHDGHTTLRRSVLKIGILHQKIEMLD